MTVSPYEVVLSSWKAIATDVAVHEGVFVVVVAVEEGSFFNRIPSENCSLRMYKPPLPLVSFLRALTSSGRTDPTPRQAICREVHARDTSRERHSESAARVGRRRRAAHDVDEVLVGREPGLGAGQGHAGGAAGAGVGEDADNLVAVEALPHGDDVALGVGRVGLVGQVRGVLRDGLAADLVKGGYPLVQVRVCRVAGEPDGFSAGGDVSAGVGLLLPLVDDWDAWLLC